MELGSFSFLDRTTEGLPDKATGLDALATGEALCFNGRATFGINHDFNTFVQAAPPAPTWTVSLIEPLSSRCSTTEWPFLRASIFTLSVA